MTNGNLNAFHDWYFTDSPSAIPSEAEAKANSTVCGLGGGYLVFNHKMLDFVRGAL